MQKNITVKSICFSNDVLKKIDKIVAKRMIPGVTNRSGFVDYAARNVLDNLNMNGSSIVEKVEA